MDKQTSVGRPPIQDNPNIRVSVYMPSEYKKWLEEQGRNTSETVRILIEDEMNRQGNAVAK